MSKIDNRAILLLKYFNLECFVISINKLVGVSINKIGMYYHQRLCSTPKLSLN